MIMGVGCDIVEIKRIRDLLSTSFASRVLTAKEKTQFDQLIEDRKAEWLAGRFAAKEAIFKSLPHGVVSVISQIEIGYEQSGEHESLYGKPVCLNIPNCRIHLSIAHEREYAIAYAICEKQNI